ncbi:hypothetical protein LOAG_12507, partial [Loa loa]
VSLIFFNLITKDNKKIDKNRKRSEREKSTEVKWRTYRLPLSSLILTVMRYLSKQLKSMNRIMNRFTGALNYQVMRAASIIVIVSVLGSCRVTVKLYVFRLDYYQGERIVILILYFGV